MTLAEIESKLKQTLADDLSGGAVLLKESGLQVHAALRRHLEENGEEIKGLSGKAEAHILEEWAQLVAEVVDEFSLEREIVRHNLALTEYRPRTSFAALPHPTGWDEVSRPDAQGFKVDRYTFVPPGSPERSSDQNRERISVLLPIANGYRRTYRALASLCYDLTPWLKRYRVEFHVCENYSDENSLYEMSRFASTLASAYKIKVYMYRGEHDEIGGSEGRTGWRKTSVLNVMLKSLLSLEQSEKCPPDSHYLHFADDDILISPERNVVQTNIEELRKGAEIVSATYYSHADQGFSAISSVRKLPEYVKAADKLCNLYGGCMTTTVARLERVLGGRELPDDEEGLPEDCVLTILANQTLHRKGESLKAYAMTKTLVAHLEPTNIVSFAERLGRDYEWGRRAVQRCVPPQSSDRDTAIKELEGVFQKIRAASFMAIGKEIENVGKPRHVLAQRWNAEIRATVEEAIRKKDDLWKRLKSEGRVLWSTHMTRHQVCKAIVENRPVFVGVLREVEEAPFGYKLVSAMREAASNPGRNFPRMSQLLAEADRTQVAPALHKNAYLFHWRSIAEESLGYEKYFPQGENLVTPPVGKGMCPFNLAEVLERARLVLAGTSQDCYIWQGLDLSEYGRAAIIRRKDGDAKNRLEELYLKYYSVIGRKELLYNSPRRIVYLQALGGELLKVILGNQDPGPEAKKLLRGETVPGHVELVETLYPKLKAATLSYAGPERHAPFDRFMQSIYIQRSLRTQVMPLASVHLEQRHALRLAAMLAGFLGRLHGSTLGMRWLLDHYYVQRVRKKSNEFDGPKIKGEGHEAVLRLLVGHLDQWRLFDPLTYRDWLEQGCDRPASIPKLLEQVEAEQGTVGPEVTKLIREDRLALRGVWRDLCAESSDFHRNFGAVGHLGLYATNLLIETNDREWAESSEDRPRFARLKEDGWITAVHLSNHSAVGMIDPAVEAAHVLAEVITQRVCAISLGDFTGTGPEVALGKSLFGIARRFCTCYEEILKENIKQVHTGRQHSRRKLDSSGDISALITRLSRIAALVLLARYNHTLEHDLDAIQRTQLIHTCVDLLHAGTTLRLRFRERFLGMSSSSATA